MDLIVSIALLLIISSYKLITGKATSTVTVTVRNDDGTVSVVDVKESNLVIGKNLMLKREPRAYHKILDEMGLG